MLVVLCSLLQRSALGFFQLPQHGALLLDEINNILIITLPFGYL